MSRLETFFRGHHRRTGGAANVGIGPVIRKFVKNDVCLMSTACLTSCLSLMQSGRTVARLVLSKLSHNAGTLCFA